jgi:hypothetical protein
MLLKSFGWSFAGHAYIQALKHSVKLRISNPEPGVFCKDPF